MTSEQETAMYDQPSGVPGFAERERGAADAWESFAALNGSITPDFRAGYHRGVIDQARRQPASEAHTPTECRDCGRTDGGCDRIMDTPTDDEREALIALKLVFFSKLMDDGYPSTVIRDNEEAADLVLAAGFHRTVQGEPSDAAVEAALRAYWGGAENAQSHGSAYGMRAALKAAAAVQGGENRG